MSMRRRPSIAALSALLVVLVLAACAPSALGDRSNPYRVDRDGPVSVVAGRTVHVEAAVPPSTFSMTRDELATRLAPWGEGRWRATVTPLLDLRDVVAPERWGVGLDRAVAYVDARRPFADVVVGLRIDVPLDARAGGYRVRAVVVDQRGRRAPVEFVVQVSDPAR